MRRDDDKCDVITSPLLYVDKWITTKTANCKNVNLYKFVRCSTHSNSDLMKQEMNWRASQLTQVQLSDFRVLSKPASFPPGRFLELAAHIYTQIHTTSWPLTSTRAWVSSDWRTVGKALPCISGLEQTFSGTSPQTDQLWHLFCINQGPSITAAVNIASTILQFCRVTIILLILVLSINGYTLHLCNL